MANRFVCRLRGPLIAATAATTVSVMEAFHLRLRHFSFNPPGYESCRPGGRDTTRVLPSHAQTNADHALPPVCGCGAPQASRRHFQSMACDSPDTNPFIVFSVRNDAPSGSEKKDSKERRGERENLLNILHYTERVLPLFFDTSLYFLKYNPPQLYTPNVILENHLKTPVKTSNGLPSLVFYQHLFRMNYTMRYMLKKLVILNTWVDEHEATVNIHFRILCCRKANLVGTSPKKADEAVMNALAERAEWHDFILTLHVTSHDRVWKLVITQKASDRPPKLHRPIRALLGRLRRRLLPQPGLPVPV